MARISRIWGAYAARVLVLAPSPKTVLLYQPRTTRGSDRIQEIKTKSELKLAQLPPHSALPPRAFTFYPCHAVASA
jgi:hypothetical protein